MPIGKLVDHTKELTTFTCYGDLLPDEILLTLVKFYQGVEDPPTRKVLWDMSNATIMTISVDDVDEIVALRCKHEGIII